MRQEDGHAPPPGAPECRRPCMMRTGAIGLVYERVEPDGLLPVHLSRSDPRKYTCAANHS